MRKIINNICSVSMVEGGMERVCKALDSCLWKIWIKRNNHHLLAERHHRPLGSILIKQIIFSFVIQFKNGTHGMFRLNQKQICCRRNLYVQSFWKPVHVTRLYRSEIKHRKMLCARLRSKAAQIGRKNALV